MIEIQNPSLMGVTNTDSQNYAGLHSSVDGCITVDGKKIKYYSENGSYFLIESPDIEAIGGIHIPYALEPLTVLEYGHPHRVRIQVFNQTGMRPCEADDLPPPEECILRGIIRWFTRKKQKKWRKEYLSKELIDEIRYMRENYDMKAGKFFPVTSETFRRQFNKDIRPKLSLIWNLKVDKGRKGNRRCDYYYNLYGYRRNFGALKWEYYRKQGHCEEMARVMVQKSMNHKSEFMTMYHYASVSQQINAKKYSSYLPFEVAEKAPKELLIDYLEN